VSKALFHRQNRFSAEMVNCHEKISFLTMLKFATNLPMQEKRQPKSFKKYSSSRYLWISYLGHEETFLLPKLIKWKLVFFLSSECTYTTAQTMTTVEQKKQEEDLKPTKKKFRQKNFFFSPLYFSHSLHYSAATLKAFLCPYVSCLQDASLDIS
jgi:hypothetical protein